MGFFDSFKKTKDKFTNKSGKDLLESYCASAAYLAMADGTASSEEVEAAVAILANNYTVKKNGFNEEQIRACMKEMLAKGTSRTGGVGLLREIVEGAQTPDDKEDVVNIALDIASADGSISEPEKTKVLAVIAKLGLRPEAFGL